MTQAILTAEQAKAARAFTGVSQAQVAKEIGINRTQLALFEVGRYLLPDKLTKALRYYYEDQGYRFDLEDDGTSEGHATSQRFPETARTSVDTKTPGEHKAASLDNPEEADPLQGEIKANDKKIAQLAAEKAEQSFFSLLGDDYLTEKRDELLLLMARNYALMRKRQEYEASGQVAKQGSKGQPKTNGELVNELFHEKFKRKETRPDTESSWLL